MKERIKAKALIAALLVAVMIPLSIIPSSATAPSQPTELFGSYTFDTSLSGGHALIMENREITFDLSDFPNHNDENWMDSYTASVKTEYTLFNPTEQEIVLQIAFPVGNPPQYYYGTQANPDLAKYSVMINGEKINLELRHVYDTEYNINDPDGFAGSIKDEYISNEFCSPKMTVTKYTFVQSDVKNSYAYVGFDVNKNELSGSIISFGDSYVHDQPYGVKRIHTVAGENGSTYELYVFGNDLKELPEFNFYMDAGIEDGEEISGKMEYIGKETMTFSELVSSYYDESRGISELDWYNMAAAEMSYLIERGSLANSLSSLKNGFSYYMVKGFIYEIILSPGERVVNTVIAPLYPSIETKYEPATYSYSYILSQGNADMNYNDINVSIITPYYMLDGEGFEKTDNGYRATYKAKTVHSENLTSINGGFYFTLCESESPEEVTDYSSLGMLFIIIALILMPILLLRELFISISNGINNIKQWFNGIIRK